MNTKETDKAAAKVAQCLHEAGATRDLIARTLNSLHDEVTYTVIGGKFIDSRSYAIHRVPEDSRPTVEVWKMP